MQQKQQTDYVIMTDSCSDLTQQQINEMGIHVLPLSVEMEGKTYFNYPDERDISFHAFYERLREKAIAKTSMVGIGQFMEAFEPLLRDGKDVLYIGFSSALSGTYNSAHLAAKELQQVYPDRKIITIDSKGASMGLGLLIYYAHLGKKDGKSISQLTAYIESIKLKITHLFTVDDLGTLMRGGRLSVTSHILGTLLKVKPILHVSNEGKLVPIHKIRGRKHALAKMVELTQEYIDSSFEQTIFISHGDCLDEAMLVGEELKKLLKIKDIVYGYVGPVIGAHSGPGTIAIFFQGFKR
ncbi:MAG TPA: DegV family protein [Acholeplasmataceae bacterium]|nr:DegV family protein [Acholeplasmataceae bacterium]